MKDLSSGVSVAEVSGQRTNLQILGEFIGNIGIPMQAKRKIESAFTITDELKVSLASILVDRWMLYKIGSESTYVKHIPSKRSNVLYQIILGGGNGCDGVYELEFKGKDVGIQEYFEEGKKILVIKSNGNYETAMLEGSDKDSCTVTRADFKTDEEFYRELLKLGFVTEEELEIYAHSDEIIKPYLDRVLPRIKFS